MATWPEVLQVPNEYRFVQALALSVDGVDCLAFLLEVGALQDEDLAVVTRLREAVVGLWNQPLPFSYAVVALSQGLLNGDSRAFVAYWLAWTGRRPAAAMEALARVGVAVEFYARPWADGLSSARLEPWREWMERVLALAGVQAALDEVAGTNVGAQTRNWQTIGTRLE